ncbi:MAG: gliding motility-associated C-terminal domain-containing protein [Phaeodactylibacter sp.]|nr:gliding motility-associated C-terminal domain-containing protein [Phaeodactylibacter sp.]MCB9299412.1 gliding motility-associated C-terminal domain-containing protein [Lewinellaceae bacterium]
MTKQLLFSTLLLISVSALSAQSEGTLYFLNGDRRLATIDPISGGQVVLSSAPIYDGSILLFTETIGLEDGQFFFVFSDPGFNRRLLTLDLATGAVQNNIPLPTNPSFVKYHCLDGRLYTIQENSGLIAIDPDTGQGEVVGSVPLPMSDATTASIDPYNNRLFIINEDGLNDRFFILDTETAAVLSEYQLPAGLQLKSMEYNCEDGFLYGLVGAGARLLRLDPATGTSVLISNADIAPNGYIYGDQSLNLQNNTLSFPGRDAGNTLRLFTISLATGAVLSSPALSESLPYFAFSYANRCIAEAAFEATGACVGSPIGLENNSKARSYFWDFGDPASADNNSTAANPVHTYDTPGEYTIRLIAGACSSQDTLTQQVDISPRPDNPLMEESLLCFGDTLLLDATTEGAAYLWQDSSTMPTLAVYESGLYAVEIILESCSETFSTNVVGRDCFCFTNVPNAFTPNDDGANDTFGLLFSEACTISNFNLRLFNRWGEEVFRSDNQDDAWDGTLDGKPAPSDTYFYIIQFTVKGPTSEISREESFTGDVSLLR